jgi:hypothetical protein
MEHRSDSAGFVSCILLVLRVRHFSLLAIVGVRHEVCHGG